MLWSWCAHGWHPGWCPLPAAHLGCQQCFWASPLAPASSVPDVHCILHILHASHVVCAHGESQVWQSLVCVVELSGCRSHHLLHPVQCASHLLEEGAGAVVHVVCAQQLGRDDHVGLIHLADLVNAECEVHISLQLVFHLAPSQARDHYWDIQFWNDLEGCIVLELCASLEKSHTYCHIEKSFSTPDIFAS